MNSNSGETSPVSKRRKLDPQLEEKEMTAVKNVEMDDFEAAIDNRYTEDQQRLLQIFPIELWSMILDSMQDPQVLKNVGNASPVFGEMLQHRRVEYLFPEVWCLAESKVEKAERDEWIQKYGGENAENDEDDSCWFKGILMLRLVSKAWKKIVSRFYFVHMLPPQFDRKVLPCSTAYQRTPEEAEAYYWLTDTFDSHDPLSLFKFLKYFKGTHGSRLGSTNPFFTRQVNILLTSTRENLTVQIFQEGITTLLEMYGHHIHVCNIVVKVPNWTVGRIYNLRRWISLLRCLISLRVVFVENPNYDNAEVQMSVVEAMRPLPKLKMLQHLRLVNVGETVGNLLLGKYNHVPVLDIDVGQQRPFYDFTNKRFPNCERLVVCINAMEDLEKLEGAQFGNSFYSLSVTFKEKVALPQIFARLSRKWGTSLRILKVYLEQWDGDWEEVEKEMETLKQKYFPGMRKNRSIGGNAS